MQSFFVDSISDGLAQLSAEDARHALKSLRMHEGEALAIACGGRRYAARLLIAPEGLYARVGEALPDTEPRLSLTLYQALPKGDKMDGIVQKCVEIGVHRIVPFVSNRCVARWEGGDKKLLRWRRIAREAAMQSGRALIPQIDDCLPFPQLAEALSRHRQALIAWEGGGLSLPNAWQGAQDLALLIGPEGGFSADEVAALPAQPTSLGPRILRTETAGLVGLSLLLMLSGDIA